MPESEVSHQKDMKQVKKRFCFNFYNFIYLCLKKNPHCIRPTDTEEVLYKRCLCFKFLNSEIKFYFDMFCVSNFLDCTCQISLRCLIIKCHLANKVANFVDMIIQIISYQPPPGMLNSGIVLSTNLQHIKYCSF